MKHFKYVIKAIVLIVLVNINAFHLNAQGLNVVIKEEPFIIDNLVSNKKITATKYFFVDTIIDFIVDDSTTSVLFQFKNKGKEYTRSFGGSIGLIDIGSKRAHWLHNYYDNAILTGVDDSVVFITENGMEKYFTYVVNRKNGKLIFKQNSLLQYWDTGDCIAVSFMPVPDRARGKLVGVEYLNGKRKWKRKMRFDYGINDYFALNDSTFLFIAKGLYTVNTKTGKGWHYDTRIAIRNYEPHGSDRNIYLFDQLVSNVVLDKDGLLFASADNISFISYDGVVQWAHNFPPKTASASQLFLVDDLVYMVNKGLGYENGTPLPYGKPFISVHSKHNGKQLLWQELNDAKFIKESAIVNNKLCIISNKALEVFNLNEVKNIYQRTFDSTFNCATFLKEEMYFITDSLFYCIDSIYPDIIKVLDKTGKAYFLSPDLRTIDVIESNSLFKQYDQYNNYILFKNSKESMVVFNFKKMLNANLSPEAFFARNKVCDIKNNELLTIPLAP